MLFTCIFLHPPLDFLCVISLCQQRTQLDLWCFVFAKIPLTHSHTHKQTAQRLPHESSAHVSRVKHTQTHTHIYGQPKGTASLLELVSDTRTSTRSISCRGDNNLCCCCWWCCFYCLTACRTRSPAA